MNEMRRLWRALGARSFKHSYESMGEYMKMFSIDSNRTMRVWTWQDATRIVEFYNLHMARAYKYGLDVPFFYKGAMEKEDLKAIEDRLVETFLTEMRKPPVKD